MSEHAKGRREDLRLLTGNGKYTSDWDLPGQVHGAFLRSDRAHAAIKSIDTSGALALPGVIAVLTGEDLVSDGWQSPQPMQLPPGKDGFNLIVPYRPALAHGRRWRPNSNS